MSGNYKVGYTAKPVTQLTSEELDAAESICRSPNREYLIQMICAYEPPTKTDIVKKLCEERGIPFHDVKIQECDPKDILRLFSKLPSVD